MVKEGDQLTSRVANAVVHRGRNASAGRGGHILDVRLVKIGGHPCMCLIGRTIVNYYQFVTPICLRQNAFDGTCYVCFSVQHRHSDAYFRSHGKRLLNNTLSSIGRRVASTKVLETENLKFSG